MAEDPGGVIEGLGVTRSELVAENAEHFQDDHHPERCDWCLALLRQKHPEYQPRA